MESGAGMTGVFRISTEIGPITTLRLDGWLSGLAVPELRLACAAIAGAFVINLAGVRFADEAGLSLLKALRQEGANLVGAGPFMSTALQ
jgi:anti-anti-sigma regulatory factor